MGCTILKGIQPEPNGYKFQQPKKNHFSVVSPFSIYIELNTRIIDKSTEIGFVIFVNKTAVFTEYESWECQI